MSEETDPIFKEALLLVAQYNIATASFLQRKLSIGYSRAARLISRFEDLGAIGPTDGSKDREIFLDTIIALTVDSESGDFSASTKSKYEDTNQSTIFDLTILPTSSVFKKYALASNLSSKHLSLLLGLKNNEPYIVDLEKLHNIIISGPSYTQKEKILDTIIFSLIFQKSAVDTKFIFIDYTRELDLYNIPHVLTQNIWSEEKFMSVIKWLQGEISRRQKLLAESSTRSLGTYTKEHDGKFPKIIVIIRNFEYFVTTKTDKEFLRDVISLANSNDVHFIVLTDLLSTSTIPANIQVNIPTLITCKASETLQNQEETDTNRSKSKIEFLLQAFDTEETLTPIEITEEEIKRISTLMKMN